MNERDISLIKECIKDWEAGALSDTAAMQVVAMIVSPPEVTDEDIQRAAEIVKELNLGLVARDWHNAENG